jgi:hypothetical protein
LKTIFASFDKMLERGGGFLPPSLEQAFLVKELKEL